MIICLKNSILTRSVNFTSRGDIPEIFIFSWRREKKKSFFFIVLGESEQLAVIFTHLKNNAFLKNLRSKEPRSKKRIIPDPFIKTFSASPCFR